ncbi:DNA polymerase III subunit gamma/tau [Fervidobacterium thailandense]|uniref:DNA polymerase III subunit gamma/tau n=1 Tax=Fervidobacterium thailandense TaxID=1008305 RepID=A0A1E3G3F9_9BACT|nr:DNA polymerase III subunit gamma/tau [Fervidobacterium thailandense]ODN30700.1 DNA polymerase III subunit gamma/tau [Fervidobacterium thailandense]
MEALYRKYRPKKFGEIVGQEHVKRILLNSLETRTISHAYIFAGPRGTGKTTTARILAKSLNCAVNPFSEPCNECESCRAVDAGSHLDVVELDAASNRGIDEIRRIRDGVNFAPAMGRYKVYIIDEVHMLTKEAFNALLKTLEEPPAHVVFVLATTNPEKIPPTIASRCQILEFKNLSVEDIVERLRDVCRVEGFDVSEDALRKIAKRAAGGLRDALSILEQVVRFTGGEVQSSAVDEALGLMSEEKIEQFVNAIVQSDTQKIAEFVENVYVEKGDFDTFTTQLIDYTLSVGTDEMVRLGLEFYRIKKELKNAEEKLLIAKLLFTALCKKWKTESSSEPGSRREAAALVHLAVGSERTSKSGTPDAGNIGGASGKTSGKTGGDEGSTLKSGAKEQDEKQLKDEKSFSGLAEANVSDTTQGVTRVTESILEDLKYKGDLSIFVALSLAKVFENPDEIRIVFDESRKFSYELLKERKSEVEMLYKNKSGKFRPVRLEIASDGEDPVLERLKSLFGEPET